MSRQRVSPCEPYIGRPLRKCWLPPTFVKDPDLSTPLVYCWIFTGGTQSPVYFYVGKSGSPTKRLGLHAYAIQNLGESLEWLGTNEKHRRVISKLGHTARLFIIKDNLFDSELRHKWEHWAIKSLSKKLGTVASCNMVLTGLPSGRKLSEAHKEVMRKKVLLQWEDPEFRRVNSDRIKRILQEVRDGTRVLQREVKVCLVSIENGPMKDRCSFLVETGAAISFFRLPASSDGGPEKSLPGILQGSMSVVRQEAIDGRMRKDVISELQTNYQAMIDHPFFMYVRRFRDSVGSYRTRPTLVQCADGTLVRLPACRLVELPPKRLSLVKVYDNLWSFWKDAEKYPMKRMEQL